jgi:hypothetical protein
MVKIEKRNVHGRAVTFVFLADDNLFVVVFFFVVAMAIYYHKRYRSTFHNFMVPRTGVEPTTLSLGRICSIQLSYRGVWSILTDMYANSFTLYLVYLTYYYYCYSILMFVPLSLEKDMDATPDKDTTAQEDSKLSAEDAANKAAFDALFADHQFVPSTLER